MKSTIIISIMLVAVLGCKEKNKQTPVVATHQVSTDTLPFYPYISAIKNEADSLEKNKTKLMQTFTNETGKEMISIINNNDFKSVVNKITEQNITQPPLKSFYNEQVFTDLTTKSTILNYTTQKDSLPVKNISVMLDAKNTNVIKRIDIKTIFTSADSTITENYAWVFGKEFYIIRYAEDPTGKGVSTKLNISWKK